MYRNTPAKKEKKQGKEKVKKCPRNAHGKHPLGNPMLYPLDLWVGMFVP